MAALGKDAGGLPVLNAGAGASQVGNGSNGIAPKTTARNAENKVPNKLQHMMHLLSRAEGKSMLTIEAFVSGVRRVWNVDVPSDVALRDVVSSWAEQQGEGFLEAAHVAGRSGGPALNLDSKILALRPQLPIRNGRLSLMISWPGENDARFQDARRSKVKLGDKIPKIKFSSRISELDRRAKSAHLVNKVLSGHYGKAGQRGVQLPCGLGDSMKPHSSLPMCGGEGFNLLGPLEARELVVNHREQSDVELFRVRLSGPKVQMDNWAATAKKFETLGASPDGLSKHISSVPFPVFITSQGRPRMAHLNWEAPHVFGAAQRDATPGSWPVVITVVEPDEEEDYRKVWPGALLLTLPKKKRGPSYVRWVIQRLCTKAFEVKVVNEKRSKLGPLRQLPWCWLCDDNLLCFFRLVSIRKNTSEPKTAAVVKKREWGDSTPMFWQAMVAVQQHPNMQKFALSGFLRDDGTATCKTHDWKYDVMSLYKAVLLNNRELKRLGVEYLPGLQKYEDVYFNSAIQRQGGQMLKCQCYCYRANQLSGKGGKARKRKLKSDPPELVPGLMDTPHFRALGLQERAAVKQLSDWASTRESHRTGLKRQRLESLTGSSKRANTSANGPRRGQETPAGNEDSGNESDSSSSSSTKSEPGADPVPTPAPPRAPSPTPCYGA